MKHRQELQRREEGSVDEEFPRRQLRSLQAVDRGVRAIIETLAAVGKLDETVIVFTSDNGFMWGEHGLWSKPFPFEESIRVPLVIRFPGVKRRIEPRLVAADLDIPATVLDVANAVSHTDGRSLIPLLLQPNLSWRDKLLIQTIFWAGIRTEGWKYVEYTSREEMLFDLINDSFEEMSKHADPRYAKVKQDLKEWLDSVKGLAITTTRMRSAVVGKPFTWQLEAWGGKKPYFWNMVNLTPKVFLGPERKTLTVNDIPVVLGPDYNQCGAPVFSKKESGLFIWKSCNSEQWHIRATPGNQSTTFMGSIAASTPLREVTGVRLGNNDILEQSEASHMTFTMEINPDYVKGFDFSLAANAIVKFDIDTRTLPRGLTLNSQSGLISGVPLQPVRRTPRIVVTDSSVRKIDGEPQDFITDVTINIVQPEQ